MSLITFLRIMPLPFMPPCNGTVNDDGEFCYLFFRPSICNALAQTTPSRYCRIYACAVECLMLWNALCIGMLLKEPFFLYRRQTPAFALNGPLEALRRVVLQMFRSRGHLRHLPRAVFSAEMAPSCQILMATKSQLKATRQLYHE